MCEVSGREISVGHDDGETPGLRNHLDAIALAEHARGLPNLAVEGLSTHFASVDEGDKEFTLRQYAAFRQCADRLPWIPVHHVSSTGAIIDLPQVSLSMVRTGIGLYGCYPSEAVSRAVALTPILSLRARVARVQDLAPGETLPSGAPVRVSVRHIQSVRGLIQCSL